MSDKQIIAQPTPGPWARETGQRFRHDSSAGIMGPNGVFIAAALDFNDYGKDAEVEANARLIAAAPAYHEACQSLLYPDVDRLDWLSGLLERFDLLFPFDKDEDPDATRDARTEVGMLLDGLRSAQRQARGESAL